MTSKWLWGAMSQINLVCGVLAIDRGYTIIGIIAIILSAVCAWWPERRE